MTPLPTPRPRLKFRRLARWIGVWALGLAVPAMAFESTASYSAHKINGWNVYMSATLADAPKERAILLQKIQSQTASIARTLSPSHLKAMRKADIWVEPGQHWRSLARYHSGKTEIYQEALNPAKFRDVEIFATLARRNHNTLVLHEMAHAYQDRKLKGQSGRIERLYDGFKARAPRAKDRCGKSLPAYALKNDKEFFATFTEAYFGKTCSYPFDRATLRKNHPEIFAFMTKTWGVAP